MTPGFSERTFEFCFNAEYCKTNAGLLASHPHLPSQRIEKDLGYDVEFQLQSGRYTKSIFFQHKVCSFAEYKAGRNAQFYDAHNGPYFRFTVDNEQHNTLFRLSQTKGNAFYCAPRFHLRHELEKHFRSDRIANNSMLLDPLEVGEIYDHERHNITFNPTGTNSFLHSEIRRFHHSYFGGEEKAPQLRQRDINSEYIEDLSFELLEITRDSRFRSFITPSLESARPIHRAQILLGRVYQVTWLLLP